MQKYEQSLHETFETSSFEDCEVIASNVKQNFELYSKIQTTSLAFKLVSDNLDRTDALKLPYLVITITQPFVNNKSLTHSKYLFKSGNIITEYSVIITSTLKKLTITQKKEYLVSLLSNLPTDIGMAYINMEDDVKEIFENQLLSSTKAEYQKNTYLIPNLQISQ